jgi:hypothetical protein
MKLVLRCGHSKKQRYRQRRNVRQRLVVTKKVAASQEGQKKELLPGKQIPHCRLFQEDRKTGQETKAEKVGLHQG